MTLVSVIDEAAPGGLKICAGCPPTEFVAELLLLGTPCDAEFVLFVAAWRAMRRDGDVDMTSLLASSKRFSKMRLQIRRSSSLASVSM